YTPATGDSFRILAAAARSGSWSTTNLPALPPTQAWSLTVDATGATLSVANVNLAPSFTSNPISKPIGIPGQAYSASIAGNATDPNSGDTLTFAKVSGPVWLS